MCLIAGDSTIIGVNEKQMGSNFKVRGFSGAVIENMYHYLHPLLEKKPSHIILMVGTNDAAYKDANKIVNDLQHLKLHIESKLPECDVILSCPTMRCDKHNENAQKTVFDLRKKLINLKVPLILNENITDKHISRRGLHLNNHGKGRLALNFKIYIRKH